MCFKRPLLRIHRNLGLREARNARAAHLMKRVDNRSLVPSPRGVPLNFGAFVVVNARRMYRCDGSLTLKPHSLTA